MDIIFGRFKRNHIENWIFLKLRNWTRNILLQNNLKITVIKVDVKFSINQLKVITCTHAS